MEDLPDFDGLKCVVCLEVMLSHIRLCHNGHSVCDTCVKSCDGTCPQCRTTLSDKRNFQLEQLIQEFRGIYQKLPCSFAKEGCASRFKGTEVQQHELSCPYRTLSCYFSMDGCPKRLKVCDMKDHEENCKFRTVRMERSKFDCMKIMCPICLEMMFESIYTCQDGHSMCGKCSYVVARCCYPQCRQYHMRNTKLEDLIREIKDILLLACDYVTDGCNFRPTLAEKRNHEKECEFRTVSCEFKTYLYDNCGWQGKIWDIAEHMNQEHTNKVFSIDNTFNTVVNTNVANKVLVILISENGLFYYKKKVDDSNVYFAIQYLGLSKVANEYTYTLTLSKDGREMSAKEICETDGVNMNTLIETQKCVAFPLRNLRKFEDEFRNLKLSIFIKKGGDDEEEVAA